MKDGMMDAPCNRMLFKTKYGTWDVCVDLDPDYPGIDIEFISDDDKGAYTRPRILFEVPCESHNNMRALCWTKPYHEDYTEEIEFDNYKMRF